MAGIEQFSALGEKMVVLGLPPAQFFPYAVPLISDNSRIKNLFDTSDFFAYSTLVDEFEAMQ